MKKLVFLFILCFSLPFWVYGQAPDRKVCGTYTKPPTTNPNAVSHTGGINNFIPNQYFDRFGNTYLEDELLVAQTSADSKCTAGFFELTFIQGSTPANFSNAEITIICKAFTDLSAKIKSVGKPRIRIAKEKQKSSGILAVGSSYYHAIPSCANVGNSEVWESINLNKISKYYMYEGFVAFNTDIQASLWHTSSTNNQTPTGLYDMYSVALHEAMHTLGIASMIKDDGTAYNGIYSLWDKYLFDNKSKKSVLIEANNPNCCGKLVQNPVPLNILAPCAETDLILSQNGTTKINTVLVGDFSNTHSHVCDDNLVMAPSLTAGQLRKFMTNPEWDLLCKIGYEIINNTPNCKNNCVVYAKDDLFKFSDPNLTSTTISESAVIANDYISSLSNYTISGFYYNDKTKNFTFPLQQGDNRFPYTVKGCDGLCSQAYISIVIPYNLPACTQNKCDNCNLVCHGDLEELSNSNVNNFTFFKTFQFNTNDNSIEIYQNNSDNQISGGFIPSNFILSGSLLTPKPWELFCQNSFAGFNFTSPPSYFIPAPANTPNSKFIHLNTEDKYSVDKNKNYNEAIYFELKEPLQIGKPYFINFDKFSGCTNALNFAFSTTRPCTKPTTINPALDSSPVPVYCGDGTTFFVPQVIKMNYNGNLNTWENISNEKTPFIANVAAKYVVIYQEPHKYSSIFLDNIFVAPKRYVPVDVTSTITEPCSINIKGSQIEVKYKICIPPTFTIPATITITPSIAKGVSGLTINTSSSFQKGIEIITLPSNGSNCIEKTLILDIDPALFSGKADILLDFISNDICYKCTHVTQYVSGANNLTGFFSKTQVAQTFPKGYTGQNGSLKVSGLLTIDKNYSFSNTNFIAEVGAKIEIAEGVKVTFDNCQFYTCGDYMWQGIEVLPPTKGNIGGEIVMTNCKRVEDAHNAIKLNNRTSATITGNIFSKNYVDVSVADTKIAQIALSKFTAHSNKHNAFNIFLKKPYKGQSINSSFPRAAYQFSNCISTCTVGQNKSGQITEWIDGYLDGITAVNTELETFNVYFKNIRPRAINNGGVDYGFAIRSENIGAVGNLRVNGIDKNTTLFEDCQTGVFSTNVRTDVTNTKMTGMGAGISIAYTYPINQGVSKIKNNYIAGQSGISAIYASDCFVEDNDFYCKSTNSAPNSAIVLNYCDGSFIYQNKIKIDDISCGIRLTNCNGGRIIGNKDIEILNSRGLSPSKAQLFTDGINIINSTQLTVQDNTVLGKKGGNRDPLKTAETVGVFMQNSSNNDFCCNSVDYTNEGVEARNANDISNKLKTTTFNEHNIGLYVRFNGSLIGTQSHTGNIWNNLKNPAARNDNSSSNFGYYKNNQFQVVDPQGTGIFPTLITPPTDWFKGFTLGKTITCNQGSCVLKATIPTITDIEVQLLKEDVTKIYGEVNTWKLTRNLYEKLDANPALKLEDDALFNFYEQYQNSNIATFTGIKTGIDYLTSFGKEQLIASENDINNIKAQIQKIDAQLLISEDVEGLLTEKNALLDALNEATATLIAQNESIKKEKQAAFEVLTERNENIPTEYIYEENLKIVNTVSMALQASESNTLSEEQRNQLEKVAYQCDTQGGEAVQSARALLTWYDEKYNFDRENTCEEIFYTKVQKNNRSSKIVLQPNPASNILSITNNLEANKVVITTLLGQIVSSSILENTSANLDISNIGIGMYLCHFFANDKIITTEKITIIR